MLICRDGYCTPIMQPTITEPQRKSTPTPSAHACSAANRLSRPTNAGTVSFPRRRESSPSNAPFPQTRSFPSARKQPPAARSTPFPYGQPLWLPHPPSHADNTPAHDLDSATIPSQHNTHESRSGPENTRDTTAEKRPLPPLDRPRPRRLRQPPTRLRTVSSTMDGGNTGGTACPCPIRRDGAWLPLDRLRAIGRILPDHLGQVANQAARVDRRPRPRQRRRLHHPRPPQRPRRQSRRQHRLRKLAGDRSNLPDSQNDQPRPPTQTPSEYCRSQRLRRIMNTFCPVTPPSPEPPTPNPQRPLPLRASASQREPLPLPF